MNYKDFKNLKVGDEVKIIKRGIFLWNSFIEAQKYPVCVTSIFSSSVYVKYICDEYFHYNQSYIFNYKDLEKIKRGE